MTTYFISDLHLEPAHPAMTQGFLEFLSSLKDAKALYILGDFFEVWMGDDFDNDFVSSIKVSLKALNERGTEIFLMPGNRDFLLGKSFCAQSGTTLIDDPVTRTFNGEDVLLMHGDSLCTRDVEYMKVRKMFRNPDWQAQFLQHPLEKRIEFARQVRNESQNGHQMKSEDIMDVTDEEVMRSMTEAGVTTMIHGHTHRPQDHRWQQDGKEFRRIVLGDWSDTGGWMIKADDNGLQLQEFSF